MVTGAFSWNVNNCLWFQASMWEPNFPYIMVAPHVIHALSWRLKVASFPFLFPNLVPRPLPDFSSQLIFLHGCEIKSGSGLGTRLGSLHLSVFWSEEPGNKAKQKKGSHQLLARSTKTFAKFRQPKASNWQPFSQLKTYTFNNSFNRAFYYRYTCVTGNISGL